jgi:hypothetical protein
MEDRVIHVGVFRVINETVWQELWKDLCAEPTKATSYPYFVVFVARSAIWKIE